MLDSTNGSPSDEVATTVTLKVCPKCQTQFQPARRNQRYCNRQCQKNAARGPRQTENARMTSQHYTRALDLAHMVYSKPIFERLGAMKDILDCVPHDAGLRRILRDPTLLCANPFFEHRYFVRGRDKTISQAANAYTQKFFGVSIVTYVQQVLEGRVNEEFPVRRA
ncbi:hypothetical protein [Aliiroseovarius crassostreae]|uniref:hypothetical protein n=1 Tax=Aliiroseovarius crassostreae TaxID=154981 RepID=UPI002202182F|nr:hypothetical protein [Aliiroseovarius crassostreae]UWQ03974.1 hypothetical protein K3X22_09725 [Aliiroseovarius crassostreae]